MNKQLGFFGKSLFWFCTFCSVVIAAWLASDYYREQKILAKIEQKQMQKEALRTSRAKIRELERYMENREKAKAFKEILDKNEVNNSKKEQNQLLKLFDEKYNFDNI